MIIKENKQIKNKIIGHIRNLFIHEKDYCKSVRVSKFGTNTYIEYE